MALVTPYCTVAEADVFLASSSIWNATPTAEKEQALFWGRVWLDANFICSDLLAYPDSPSETVKFANALLAEDYLDGTLTDNENTSSGVTGIKRLMQKAGSVEQETEYFEGGGTTEIDYQEDVKLLLDGECVLKNGTSTIDLTRV